MPADKRYRVEAYWDCAYCGAKGIRGRFASCPNCGHGRDASVRFYTKDIDEAHAIDEEEFAREQAEARKNSRSDSAEYSQAQVSLAGEPSLFSRGEGQGTGTAADAHDASDWYCDYCDSYNPATVDVCQNCGAAREQSSGKTYEQTQGKVARTYDSHGNLVRERDLSQRTRRDTAKPAATAQPAPHKGGFARLAIVLGAVAVLAMLGMLLFGPKAKSIAVESFDWTQTIEIEQLKTVSEDGWSLPDGARLDHTAREIREYEQVFDHYETVPYQVSEQVLDHYETYTTEVDNGDGTFDVEEHSEPVYTTEYHTEYRQEPVYVSVPVYDTKYYYDIEKWVPARDVTTSGNNHEPYWGEVELAEGEGEYGVGKEREGKRSGTYYVTDTNGKRYAADLEFWQTLELGQKLKVWVDGDRIRPKE